MPDSGGLQPVEGAQSPDPQVRVFALPPQDNASPSSIVDGFLDALTSDDPSYTMARKYLTKKAAKAWRPEQRTTVLDSGPNTTSTGRPNTGDEGRTFTITGQQVATIDRHQAYHPDRKPYRGSLHLSQVDTASGKQWRIDSPPDGVVLGQFNFQRIYESVNKYYYAESQSASDASRGQKQLVADPVFVRQWTDPLTETVRQVVAGPSNWLNPVVTSAFPSGTALKDGVTSLTPDDANKLTVPLNDKADGVGQRQCKEMAAQLLFSLRDLASSAVDEVELKRSDGGLMCALTEDAADGLVSQRAAGRFDHPYFLDSKGRLAELPGNNASGKSPEPVAGPLGEGRRELRSVAVAHDQDQAAGVSVDGRSLYVASLVDGASLGSALVHSQSRSESDGLSTPSWDGRGDLWVADRDPKNPRLLMFGQGRADRMQQVQVDGLGDGARVEAVKMSSDGVRVALLVKEASKDGGKGTTQLRIGRVERHSAAEGGTEVSVTELRPAAPEMEEVTAMSWAGSSQLVVVGREAGGLQQIRYVPCDGSAPTGQALPGLAGVSEVTASDDDRLPLLAHSDDGIVRLPSGASWQSIVKDGTAPVYPG
ncbi:LpqB family beta-propeller domain-containing protein [Streptomyces beihaiensis]|uniref:LpqB family beta-propeller domain-containing protein n=1 Tax=Streptomyces beihaiensis TaxID=2984495 RepID=A0ABT3U205_9ACTN|nr:LpqB family beta-propeller domain-containing protein [Streptomyces beihaiensis]